MVWDKTLPIEGALAPTYNNIMRADKTALEAALNAYMYFVTGGTQTGQPRQGSARPYFQDSAPTTRLDGDHFDSTDLGTPWIDSNASPDNQYNILTAANGAGTNTWTPISTEVIAVLLAANRIFAGTLKSTGDFTVGANKVVVTAANGNTAVAGTLGVTGVATLGDTSALATSGAPAADAQIANKKYVDDQVDTQNITPASYAGEESITFANGFIMKQGTATPASAADATVTFAAAFPTAITNAWTTWREVVLNDVENCGVHTMAVGSMKIRNPNTGWASKTVNWFAIGY